MPISTNVMTSNPAHGDAYSIQHTVYDKVTCDGSVVSVTNINKSDRHDIAEILLKVTLSTITLTKLKI